MSSSYTTPAILGGTPVRTGPFRTTPEADMNEVAFVGAQILSRDWEPDAELGGFPVAAGLSLSESVHRSLGYESAALAAEFALLQAPEQREVVPVPCNNGTQAIKLALAALSLWTRELGLRPLEVGGEVLVPALTWQATAGAVLRRGLVPVLVDVVPGTLCMDPTAVRAAITDRTVAVIPVHLYNRMTEMDEIVKIAGEHGLAVIEDCAHAQGAVYLLGEKAMGAGTIGHAGTFSMQGSKSLSSQEGGLIVTSIAELVDQICSVVTCGRQVGSSKRLQADNDRMAGAIAALARAQILRFPAQNGLRRAIFAQFDAIVHEELRGLGLRVSDPQPNVVVTPTYKEVVRIDLSEWGGMTLGQWRAAMEAELGCELATVYEPLTDSPLYDPLSDPALHLSDEFAKRIDPAQYDAPIAWDVFETTAVIEHAAFLDPEFPEKFVEAARKVREHCKRLAREVTVA